MNSTDGRILNPYTPLAWVTPKLASKLTHHHYASIWSLAVLLWDIIIHIPEDYQLVTKYNFNKSLVVYCISRSTSLAYVLGLVIVTTIPIGNCDYVRYISFIYPLTTPVTALLFVLRVCALHGNKKYIIAFFSLTWLSVLGSSIALAVGVEGKNIANTKYCIESKTEFAGTVGTIFPAIHDTFVFWATCWAFAGNLAHNTNAKEGVKILVLGKHLPAFSRSLLRDGQAYYLITLIMTMAVLAMYTIPDPLVTPCTFAIPLFVLTNNMSCYVYRNMRFGFYRDEIITTSIVNRALERSMIASNNAEQLVFPAREPVPGRLLSLTEEVEDRQEEVDDGDGAQEELEPSVKKVEAAHSSVKSKGNQKDRDI